MRMSLLLCFVLIEQLVASTVHEQVADILEVAEELTKMDTGTIGST